MYNGKGQDIIFNILISKNKFFKSYKKSKKEKFKIKNGNSQGIAFY